VNGSLLLLLFVGTFHPKADISFAFGLGMLLLNFVIVLPLTLLGGTIGDSTPVFNPNPCEISVVPRRGNSGSFLLSLPIISLLVGSVCSIMFVQEAEIILTAIKRSMFSWMFLFLLIALIATLVISGVLAVVVSYLLFTEELHEWHWISFIAPFSSALFVFLYAVQYIVNKTQLEGTEQWPYFAYAGIVALGYGLICGSAGFLSANVFVRVIFESLNLS
jgi:transmembrane 9 superfamily protein 2/4